MSNNTRSVPAPGGTYLLGDHEVARIGYGAMQLRHCAANPAEAATLLERAVALGIDHIDTAQFYGNGFVNEVIRKVLSPGNGLVVASKIGADPDPQGKIQLNLRSVPHSSGRVSKTTSSAWAWSKSPWSICVVPMLDPVLSQRAISSSISKTKWR